MLVESRFRVNASGSAAAWSALAGAARGRRPSVCGLWPPPLASPQRDEASSADLHRIMTAAEAVDHEAARPNRRPDPASTGLRPQSPAQDWGPSDSPAGSRSCGLAAPRYDPILGLASVSATSPPCSGAEGFRFVSAFQRLGTRRPPVAGEAGGSPWLRDHHAPVMKPGNRPLAALCGQICA